MIDDIRYGFRQLYKNPGFAAVAVITLALGIGAAAAMFGLIQGVLLSPPPYVQPDRLVLVTPARLDGQPYEAQPTNGQWMAWRASSRTIEPPALYRWTFNFLVLPDGSESLGGMAVSRNYFKLLGLRPMLGRDFLDAESARPNSPPTAVIIGYDLWQRRFNKDPGIVGRAIRISRMPTPLQVVGVMPPGVRFLPDPGNASEPNYDVDAPVDFWLSVVPNESDPKQRGWNVVSRLQPGASAAQASADVAAISARLTSTDPDLQGLTARAQPLMDVLNVEGRRLLLPLFGSVALVFLIASANVSGLLLARGLRRQQDTPCARRSEPDGRDCSVRC